MSEQPLGSAVPTQMASALFGLEVFAVVVVYKVLPAECSTLRTLLAAARMAPGLRLHVRVVDNTPGGQDPGVLPAGVEYCALPENPGLSKPYNAAWRVAESEGYGWLLTLDQDTHLPENYFVALAEVVRLVELATDVAVIVPRIADRGQLVSPVRYVAGFLPMVVPATVSGRLGRHALAFNSASLVRVSALRAVGGYDEAFPLHNSDSALFARLDRAGKRVVLAGEIAVSHELAIMDRSGRMSGERYRSMLADERAFWDVYMGFWGRVERGMRLLLRVVKDAVRGERGGYTGVTLREFWYRMRTRRKTRVARWVAGRTG